MGDLQAANDRCTCMEVYGEDPNCVLHGIATKWALEHTLPSEWQNNTLETADELTALRNALEQAGERFQEITQITAGCATSHGDDGGGLQMSNAVASEGWDEIRALLAKQGGEVVIANIAADLAAGRTESQHDG